MKVPDNAVFRQIMIATVGALNAAIKADFDADSCECLDDCLAQLNNLVFEEGEGYPIEIEDPLSLATKILRITDVAFCCWSNGEPAIVLPIDVTGPLMARLTVNEEYRRDVMIMTKGFLERHGKKLSEGVASFDH